MPNGGVIGKANTPTTSVASGVWTLDELFNARDADIWPGFVPIQATGGTVQDVTISGVLFRIHTFTTVGTSAFVVQDDGSDGNVDVLVVAGGGGGGATIGGGGGAGGLVYKSEITVTETSYPVSAGAGGLGGFEYRVQTSGRRESGLAGSNSTAFGLTALGGGYGAGWTDNPAEGDGGSGGGGSAGSSLGPGQGLQPGTNSTADIDAGNNGSNGLGGSNRTGGAGGGADGAGGAPVSETRGGNGGPGLDMSAYFGTSFGENGYLAGGGGGGGDSSGGNGGDGGIGGGGFGGDMTGNHGEFGEDGQPNTGGGGGAGPYHGFADNNRRLGGDGGSGIVIVRYPLEAT